MLEGEGFAVRVARDGADALVKFSQQRPDAVLLDVMMPKLNGFTVCAEIRKTDALLPVVFLTAKDSEADEIRGMGLGADDYVSKSAGEEVLLARLRRAIERAAEAASAGKDQAVLKLGTVEVDLERRKVLRGGEAEALTASEFDILKCLASAPGKPFTADELLSFLRGEGYIGDPATVRVHIMNLRRKLGKAGAMIANLPKGGYYLVGT
jgi:DNA-binding response OmpR family regulator